MYMSCKTLLYIHQHVSTLDQCFEHKIVMFCNSMAVQCFHPHLFSTVHVPASFQPPDVPVDEISNPPLELDEDDIQWQQWLADLMMPASTQSEEEQDDDTEYNFSADKQMEEREEFRNDRAVRIPRE